MNEIIIGNKKISRNSQPYIVAEAGINHNGEIEKAFEMIKVAQESGADAIKFQTFKAEEFVNDPNQTYTYISQGKEITESMLEMFKRYEFNENDWIQIRNKCNEEGITFLSTPQNQSDLELLMRLGIEAIKVGSDDFTNLPLLKSYSETKLPLIISMGMADLAEVYNALNTIGSFDGYPTILLLCTSQYPTPPEDVNLLKLKTIINTFPAIIAGFSDHTQGTLASSLAVALGATFFEKHFTLDNALPGPDHWFSENSENLKTWIKSIKTSWEMLGSFTIRPTIAEQKMRVIARRSIVACKKIKPGEKFSLENLSLKRPGNGLIPSMLNTILGMKASKIIEKGKLIDYGDIE